MNLEKQKNFLIRFTYWTVILALVFIIAKYAMAYLASFVIAFIIAYCLNSPIEKLQNKLRCKRTIPAIALTVLFYLIAGLLITLLGVRLVSFAKNIILAVPSFYENTVLPTLTNFFYTLEHAIATLEPSAASVLDEVYDALMGPLGSFVTNLSVTAIGILSDIASSIPGLFVNTVIMIIVTFFMTIDYPVLSGFVVRQLPDKGKMILGEVKGYVSGTLIKCILSYALIMFITCVELSIGLSILGIKNAILIAACISIFDIMPVLGTGGIMIPWTVISLCTGNIPIGIGLLIIYILITIIRNIIEPKIVGHQVGLHPVVTLASMFAGVNLFGVIGLFGFPITLSLLKNMNDKGIIHLFKSAE